MMSVLLISSAVLVPLMQEPPEWNSVLRSWAQQRRGEVVRVWTMSVGQRKTVVHVRAAWGPDRLVFTTVKNGKTSTFDYHNGIALDLGPEGARRILIKPAGRRLKFGDGFAMTSALILLWDPFLPPTHVYGPPTQITSDGDEWKCKMGTFEGRTGAKTDGWINKRTLLPTRFCLMSKTNGKDVRMEIGYDFSPKPARPDTTKRKKLPDRTEEDLDIAFEHSQFRRALP